MQSFIALATIVNSLLTLVTASKLTPPALPLVVRNPYLSTWLANAREEPWSKWPMFYTGESVGLSLLASVPDTKTNRSTVYPLLGRPHDALDDSTPDYNVSFATYLGAQYDASTTNLSYSITSPYALHETPVELTLSFLSPITPTSTLRQSIPAAYLTVDVRGGFDLSIYVDVDSRWASGYDNGDMLYSYEETNEEMGANLKTFSFKRTHEMLFTEYRDRAQWGELHFTGPSTVEHEKGYPRHLRRRFARHGELQSDLGKQHDIHSYAEESTFAFSKRFELSAFGSELTNSTRQDSVLFTIAHTQHQVTQFASARGLTYMRPLWKSYFNNDSSLIAFNYNDFKHARRLAADYSAQVATDAYASGGENYRDIAALSARQVMGATSFSGTADNPLLFLKEISSNGNCQTIDVVFPSFPFFLYTNPKWLAYLLEPLMEHMLSGQYPNQYAMHDLGTHFPNMTGHPFGDDEYMPVEECGDILVMGLALMNSLTNGDEHAASTQSYSPEEEEDTAIPWRHQSSFALPTRLRYHDGILGLDEEWNTVDSSHTARKWVSRSYKLWKQWTSYLVKYSLMPENQLCTDDFAGRLKLQSNLALKGIIGIKAMSELSKLVGEEEDTKYYRNISDTYIRKWEEYAMSADGSHAKLAYHWQGSWTTLYSLYADALLCFHPNANNTTTPLADEHQEQQPLPPLSPQPDRKPFIPTHIYTLQSTFYARTLQTYGLPLDSRHLYTKSDWALQAAAVASPPVRREIIDRIAKWVNETSIQRPLSDLYETEGEGGMPETGPEFFARPVVGAFFARLALERACGGRGAEGMGW